MSRNLQGHGMTEPLTILSPLTAFQGICGSLAVALAIEAWKRRSWPAGVVATILGIVAVFTKHIATISPSAGDFFGSIGADPVTYWVVLIASIAVWMSRSKTKSDSVISNVIPDAEVGNRVGAMGEILDLKIGNARAEIDKLSGRVVPLEQVSGTFRFSFYALFHLYCRIAATDLEPLADQLRAAVDEFHTSRETEQGFQENIRLRAVHLRNEAGRAMQTLGVDMDDLQSAITARRDEILKDSMYRTLEGNDAAFWATGDQKREWHLLRAELEVVSERFEREIGNLRALGGSSTEKMGQLRTWMKEYEGR